MLTLLSDGDSTFLLLTIKGGVGTTGGLNQKGKPFSLHTDVQVTQGRHFILTHLWRGLSAGGTLELPPHPCPVLGKAHCGLNLLFIIH